jgi:hypothetical protein
MINCPSCSSNIDDDSLNFCPTCEKQVKCLNKECRAILKSNNSICLTCGEKVKNSNDSSTFNTLNIDTTQEGNAFSQKIAVRATDASVGHLSSIVMPLINANRGTGNIQQRPMSSSIGNRPSLPANTIEAQVKNFSENQATKTQEDIEALTQEAILIDDEVLIKSIEEYFRIEDANNPLIQDAFRKIDFCDIKKTKRGKFTNTVLFYLLACELSNIDAPQQGQIFKLLDKEKLLDRNQKAFFAETIVPEYLTKEQNGGYRLHFKGKEKLRAVLNEIYNPIPSNNIKKVSGVSRKSTSVTKVNPTVHSWIENTKDIDKLSTSKITTSLDWALFTAYLLTKHLKLVETFSPGNAYEYITTLRKAISLDRKFFRDSISRGKKLFDKNPKGEYFLTKEGVEKAKTEFFELPA